CVSKSLRQEAIALGIESPDRLLVLAAGSSNGVDINRFSPTLARAEQGLALRQRFGIGTSTVVIGFVGRLTRDKGICELVEAYRSLRKSNHDVCLLLVGGLEDGDPLPSSTTQSIKEDRRIVQSGSVEDVAPYYHMMDVLALPSYREGFPNVV